ncbi:MAG: hypothetical protein ABGZ23_21175 [Fuerstiella sp.]|nr:hypothetical protein [Fuerstiella sp.]
MPDNDNSFTSFSRVTAHLTLFLCLIISGNIVGCGDSSSVSSKATPAGAGVRLSKNPDGGVKGATFSGPHVVDNDVKVIADYSDLKSITFMECPAVTDAAMKSLNSQTGLTSLIINNTEIGDAGLLSLSADSMASLKSLMLTNLPATDAGMSCLAAMPGCDDVELFGLTISDEGLQPFSNLSALRRLCLQNCGNITGTGLSNLSTLSELQELDLRGTVLSEQGMQELGRLVQLHSLLLDAENTTDEGLAQVSMITALKKFSFTDVPVTDDGLAHVASLQQLEELNIFECKQITNDGLIHLAKLKSMKRLSLMECPMLTGDGMVHLEAMTGLELLSVTDSPVPEKAVRRLKEFIPQCTIYFGITPATQSL